MVVNCIHHIFSFFVCFFFNLSIDSGFLIAVIMSSTITLISPRLYFTFSVVYEYKSVLNYM